MVTLDVRFKCEICGEQLMHQIRVGPHFFLGADNMPDGWVAEVDEYCIRTWCPVHAMHD